MPRPGSTWSARSARTNDVEAGEARRIVGWPDSPVAAWLKQGHVPGGDVDVLRAGRQTWAVGVSVPPAAERLLTADVAQEIAEAFGDRPVYPGRVVVDGPADRSRRFPGWPGPVLVLAEENQGVCSWGVPLDGGSGRVLVGGDLLDTGHATVAYAASVEDFIAARRWDYRCFRHPLLMAQAAELDQASLGYLRARLAPAVATAGWPGPRQYRFEHRDVRVMLWSCSGQCDWWVSAADKRSLKAFAAGLLDLSNLRRALYSNDACGARVLNELAG